MHAKSLNHVRLFVIPWTVAHQAPLSMGFSGKNTGVGCHAVLQGMFLTHRSNTLAGGFFMSSATWEAQIAVDCILQILSHGRGILGQESRNLPTIGSVRTTWSLETWALAPPWFQPCDFGGITWSLRTSFWFPHLFGWGSQFWVNNK